MALPIVMAITGASGAVYGRRLLDCLVRAGRQVHLIVSPMGAQLVQHELGVQTAPDALLGYDPGDAVRAHRHDDLAAIIASGSFLTGGMAICPCSSHTLSAVAAGLGDNLVTRAAAVAIKEHRRLVLVPREMPLSLIEIEAMAAVSRAGAVVCPACPPFYNQPRSIDNMVECVVGKVLDLLGVEHSLPIRYQP